MNKVNARLMTCDHCSGERALAVTQFENGEEFAVCYNCGRVEVKHKFEALDFIVELMRDGITREAEIAECLTDKLSDEYYWIDDVDVEALAKLMTHELYDKAKFEYQVEKDDLAEAAREIMNAWEGSY